MGQPPLTENEAWIVQHLDQQGPPKCVRRMFNLPPGANARDMVLAVNSLIRRGLIFVEPAPSYESELNFEVMGLSPAGERFVQSIGRFCQ